MALNLDVPWSTKKRLRAVAHELEDLEKKATMTSVLVRSRSGGRCQSDSGSLPGCSCATKAPEHNCAQLTQYKALSGSGS